MAKSSGYTEATLALSMTAKQPPSYDGKVSWFRYEELVDDWVTITTVEAPKRGPLLKSRLTGDAYMYKAVLQNDLLQDPDEGVNYFKNTLQKYFLKGATNVYLYRLLSFFNQRRQNQEFLIFTSKFEILLMRLKAAWMDLMPVYTAQSPSFRQSVQDANNRTIARHQQAAGTRAPPPVLLNEDDPTVLRQYITGMQDRQRDAFPFGDNLIARFFIIQSELSDQQRERLTSALSLRNISLANYSYEMLKTHYHELFITTRTSIQDPSTRPQGGNRSNTFFILEQGEYEGEEGFWVEDEEGLEGFMSNNDEETFWVLEENDAFIARKVSGRNFRFKKRKGKGQSGNKKGVTNEVALNHFEKAVLAGRPIGPMKTMIPTTRHIVEKAKERREIKDNPNSNIPMMETKVIHPMRMAKEKADMTKANPKRSQPSQRSRRSILPRSKLLNSKSLPMPVGQTKIGINHGHGTNKAGTHPMRHPAQDKHSWHSMTHISSMRKKPSTGS